MRALECSGPCPSWPCGSSSVRRARLPPLRLRAGQELVDDHLRAVREVAELRLPHHERAVLRHRVAELEAQHGGLREQRVVDLEADARRRDAGEGHVLLLRLRVVQHGVALREGAALRVLAREPHVDTLEQQRAPGERLGGGPVHVALALQKLRALPDEGQRASGAPRSPRAALPRAVSTAFSRARIAEGSTAAGGRASRRADGRERRGGGRHLGGHLGLLLRPQPVQLLARDDALAHELVAVERGDRRVRLDLRVHERLGVARLVRLVVAPAPVADEVDHHVLPELLAVLEREPGDVDDGLRVVAVHVEGGGVDHLRDVRRVGGRARVLGQRREADLVVHDDVDRAARAVAVETREVHRLGHDPLPGEGRVAVHQQRAARACARGRPCRPAWRAPSLRRPGSRTRGGSGSGRASRRSSRPCPPGASRSRRCGT